MPVHIDSGLSERQPAEVPPLRQRVARHYDVLSPHYRRLWGQHLHHGYYERGDESKEEAALALLEHLVGLCDIEAGARVLDVGCGFGGTSRYLSERLGCTVVGVTLSRVQARMARDESAGAHTASAPTASAPTAAARGDGRRGEIAAGTGASRRAAPMYVVGDGSRLPFRGTFDNVLAMEVLSHVEDRGAFFAAVGSLLRRGGRVGIAAWLRAEGLGPDAEHRFIEPIERGMLVRLPDLAEYRARFAANGFEPRHVLDVSARVAPTWDLCLDMLRDRALWSLAWAQGRDVVEFLRSFAAMRRGFASGAFRYGLLVAERV